MVECPELLEDGVYRYVPGKGWVRGWSEAGGKPRVYLAVNSVCARGCRWALERLWERLGRLIEQGYVELFIVVCTRFRYVCLDETAKRFFAHYGIIAVPSIIVETPRGEPLVVQGRLRIEDELGAVAERLSAQVLRGAAG